MMHCSQAAAGCLAQRQPTACWPCAACIGQESQTEESSCSGVLSTAAAHSMLAMCCTYLGKEGKQRTLDLECEQDQSLECFFLYVCSVEGRQEVAVTTQTQS
eukprot:1153931-Pelagomonas_calceolata.AAC.11